MPTEDVLERLVVSLQPNVRAAHSYAVLRRLIREALEYFDTFDFVPWANFRAALEGTNLVFTYKKNGARIVLSEVLWDQETGEVIRANCHYGTLVM